MEQVISQRDLDLSTGGVEAVTHVGDAVNQPDPGAGRQVHHERAPLQHFTQHCREQLRRRIMLRT